MQVTDKAFTGSIPAIYDRYLAPLIFESYAFDLATRLVEIGPHDLLETAVGTGVFTRAMASQLPGHVRIVATHLNKPMLDHARTRQPREARVE